MQRLVGLLFMALPWILFAQEDTTSIQEIGEVNAVFTRNKEIAYSDDRFFIMDFHIDTTGKYLLVTHFKKYYVYALDWEMNVRDRLHLPFHPRQLYIDCMGRLQVVSKDSMYRVGEVNGHLRIEEQSSIKNYFAFYQNCMGKADGLFVMKRTKNYGQTTEYFGLNNSGSNAGEIYRVEDSAMVRSVREEAALVSGAGKGSGSMGELDPDQIAAMRDQLERKYFYDQIVSKPAYNPLFILHDTLYVFDHINGYRVLLDVRGNLLDKIPITYHQSRYWAKEIKLDQVLERFYAMEQKNGVKIFDLLSDKCEVVQKSPIDKHAYPQKIIVYNGFAYYTYKEHVEDNLNKLFRQRL